MKNGIKALIGAAALALAFAGGVALAPAVVTAVAAQTAPQSDQTMGNRGGPGHDPFSVAAQYIGITVDQLRTEMGMDKSIADVAVAHGKTRDGLVRALTDAEQQHLSQRITQLVDHKGAPQGPQGFPGPFPGSAGFALRIEPFQVAATYLGISAGDLQAKLTAGPGQTLAQIAAATPNKSREGLIKAIVDDETAKIDQAVKDNKLTADQATKLKSGIQDRISHLVDRTPGRVPEFRHGSGPGFGPGPRGSQPSASQGA